MLIIDINLRLLDYGQGLSNSSAIPLGHRINGTVWGVSDFRLGYEKLHDMPLLR